MVQFVVINHENFIHQIHLVLMVSTFSHDAEQLFCKMALLRYVQLRKSLPRKSVKVRLSR